MQNIQKKELNFKQSSKIETDCRKAVDDDPQISVK